MTDDDTSTSDTELNPLDLSGLSTFQFGPAWAKQDAKKEQTRSYTQRPRRESYVSDRAPRGRNNRQDRPNREENGGDDQRKPTNRRGQGFRRDGRKPGRGNNLERRREEAKRRAEEWEAKKAPGVNAEIHPVDSVFVDLHAEIAKHKQVVALLDVAREIVKHKDQYEVVFTRQSDGPRFIKSKKGDFSCWLSKEEAVHSIWSTDLFNEYYQEETQEVEAPKGNFTSIAKCRLNGRLIGPANWHGYQRALIFFHRDFFPNMSEEDFRRTIETEHGEEVVQKWLEQVTVQKCWKPKREGAEDVILEDRSAVEKDFTEHHFNEVFDVVDKVSINGATPARKLSEGLAAHVALLADHIHWHPTVLISHLCRGCSRHRMPIVRWNGFNHTGPSHLRAIPKDVVWADNITKMIAWIRGHAGAHLDTMLDELCGKVEAAPEQPAQPEEPKPEATPAPEGAETAPEAQVDPATNDVLNKRAQYALALKWLCSEGYVVFFKNSTLAMAKNEVAKDAPKPKKAPAAEAAPAPQAEPETPVATEAPAETPAEPAEAPTA
jgi:hypothetical protein